MSDLQRYFAEKWDAEGATEKLYHTHDLTKDSIVWDVGGYTGEWAQIMADKYDPHIQIFEPINEFCVGLHERFLFHPKIDVHNYGLGSRDAMLDIYRAGSGTSLYRTSNSKERAQFREAPGVALELCGVDSMADVKIDLISINIEGGEYDLLMSMVNSGLVYRCRDIQIQFHPLWANSYDERNRLRNLLLQTHDELYSFPFVWEAWRRR